MKLQTIIDETLTELELVVKTPSADHPEYLAVLALEERPKALLGKKRGTQYRIEPNAVFWFESVDEKVFLYTEKDTFETHYRLYELESMLPKSEFLRVGKSAIVALTKIRSFRFALSGRIEATLRNGEKVLVSRAYVKALRSELERKGDVTRE